MTVTNEPNDEPTDEVDYGPTTAQRIVAVMAAIGNIGKPGTNEQQHYAFRGIDHIAPNVRDAMIAHGLLVSPVQAELLDAFTNPTRTGGLMHTARVRITYAFRSVNDPDDVIHAQVLGEGADAGDKCVTKAMTSAYKYAMLQTFVIADGADDADRTTTDEQVQAPPPTQGACTPDEVEQVRAALAQVTHEPSKAIMREWWKSVRFGNLADGHLDAQHLPAFLALARALAGADDSTTEQPGS